MHRMAHTILIVDDDKMFSDMLSEILTAEGYSVYTAHDGAEGVVRAVEKHPDLIIMDLLMPRLSGSEAIQKLREDAWGSSVPVLLLTNMAQIDICFDPAGKMECLLKTDWTLDGIAKKAGEFLAQSGQS